MEVVVSFSEKNTLFLFVAEFGRLFTFGSNTYGQLGHGDYRKRPAVQQVVGVLLGKYIQDVACGDGFTMVSTAGMTSLKCGAVGI